MTGEPIPDVDDLAEDAMRLQHVIALVQSEYSSRLPIPALSVLSLCQDLAGELGRKIDRLPRGET